MKYFACTLPMLLGLEIVSIICLIVMALCFFSDVIKADERRCGR